LRQYAAEDRVGYGCSGLKVKSVAAGPGSSGRGWKRADPNPASGAWFTVCWGNTSTSIDGVTGGAGAFACGSPPTMNAAAVVRA